MDKKSARKRIPEVARQICAELGLADDDTQALIVAAILVTFHQDVESEARASFSRPPHEADCPASIAQLGMFVDPSCSCGAEPESVTRDPNTPSPPGRARGRGRGKGQGPPA